MRTINLQTVYQLVITALLLGACLGLLGQRLPALLQGTALPFEQPIVAAPASNSFPQPQANQATTGQTKEANVQVEVEVHARGNASAQASALGPGDTEVKASTAGDGDGRSVAYLKAPDATWSTADQSSSQSSAQPALGDTAVQASADAGMQAKVIVVEAMANLRSSPSLEGAVLGSATRGQEFTIVGRNATQTWWLVCCEQAQPLWIYSGVVQISGNVAQVSVVEQPVMAAAVNQMQLNSTVQMVSLPTPTLAAALPEPITYAFTLAEQTQFEEHIVPRIFFYVHQQENGLGGYTVRVRKDGIDLPVAKATTAGLPGYTWPIPNERQRYANLKVEFPQVAAAGLWEIQLLDEVGNAVGPIAIFRLQPGDTHQEMYVRYHKQ